MMDAVCPVVSGVVAGTGVGGVGAGGSSAGGGPAHFVVPEDMQHLGIAPIGDPHHASFVNTLIYSQVGELVSRKITTEVHVAYTITIYMVEALNNLNN